MCRLDSLLATSLMAMRRTSWIDQRISDGVAVLLCLPWFGGAFFGGGGLARWRIAAILASDLLQDWSTSARLRQER